MRHHRALAHHLATLDGALVCRSCQLDALCGLLVVRKPEQLALPWCMP